MANKTLILKQRPGQHFPQEIEAADNTTGKKKEIVFHSRAALLTYMRERSRAAASAARGTK